MIGPRVKRQYRVRLAGVVYIIVAVFIGLAAMNSQANLLFWTFGLMLGGMMVSGLISGFMMLGLHVRRTLPDHGMAGQPMTIHYELTNTKRLLPCFSMIISEDTDSDRLRGRPHAFCLHVGPGATGRADAVAWPNRRGRVSLGPIRVSTTFPFGIIRKSVLVEQPGWTVIYPEISRLNRALLARLNSRDPEGSRATRESDGGEEFFGLREYRPGDSLRFIHWRHSARIGELVSREMTRLSPPRLMVMLDVRDCEPGDERAERAVSFAASLLNESHLSDEEVGLAVVGAPCPTFSPRHSRWHLTRMLRSLGELEIGRRDIPPEATPMVRGTRWIVIHAGRVDPTLMAAQGATHLTADDMARYRIDAADRREAETSNEGQADHTPGRRPLHAHEEVASA